MSTWYTQLLLQHRHTTIDTQFTTPHPPLEDAWRMAEQRRQAKHMYPTPPRAILRQAKEDQRAEKKALRKREKKAAAAAAEASSSGMGRDSNKKGGGRRRRRGGGDGDDGESSEDDTVIRARRARPEPEKVSAFTCARCFLSLCVVTNMCRLLDRPLARLRLGRRAEMFESFMHFWLLNDDARPPENSHASSRIWIFDAVSCGSPTEKESLTLRPNQSLPKLSMSTTENTKEPEFQGK